MIDRAIYDLARAKARQNKQQNQWNRENPGGPWTPLAVIFIIVPFALCGIPALLWKHEDGLAVACAVVAVALTVLVAVGAASVRNAGERQLSRYDRPPANPDRPEIMRERAALIEELDAQQEIMAGKRHVSLSPRVATTRNQRVAGLLAVRCPVPECGAGPGTSCNTPVGRAFVIVRLTTLLYCHPERMREALREGTASKNDIMAQFSNDVPAGII